MSDLEKQAATIRDFYQDCIAQIISKGKQPRRFNEKQKWVPLDEANFRIAEKQTQIDILVVKIEAFYQAMLPDLSGKTQCRYEEIFGKTVSSE